MRIQEAYADLHPVHRPRTDIPLNLTPELCASPKNLYLKTDVGSVDCLGEILGLGGYDEVARHAVAIELPAGTCQDLPCPGSRSIDPLQRSDGPRPRQGHREASAGDPEARGYALTAVSGEPDTSPITNL